MFALCGSIRMRCTLVWSVSYALLKLDQSALGIIKPVINRAPMLKRSLDSSREHHHLRSEIPLRGFHDLGALVHLLEPNLGLLRRTPDFVSELLRRTPDFVPDLLQQPHSEVFGLHDQRRP